MTHGRSWFVASLIVLTFTTCGFTQKVKIGYDKSADFSKYKTYTWAKPDHPVERPQVYQDVVGTIDQDLQAKGLTRVPTSGDLTLSAAGGIDFGYNAPPTATMDPVMWQGEFGAPVLNAPLVAQGSLTLQFIDGGKMVWKGTVMQKLDPEQKNQALVLAQKAVDKLLKGFPPKH
jgi:Domain of unknown function (DUF4136)